MRKLLKRWAAELARDDGVAGLIIAMIIMVVAATTLMVFLSDKSGPGRDITKMQEASRSQELAFSAVMAAVNQNGRVPCPAADTDGDEATPCVGTGVVRGLIPWKTLGLSREDALDGHDRYLDYVVAAPEAQQAFCVSVGNDFGNDPEYTGEMNPFTSLQVQTTAGGDGSFVPFVILSHGENGFGAIPYGSATRLTGGTGFEATNINPTNTVYSGPFDGDESAPFDDAVSAPTGDKLQAICEGLTPGGGPNASFGDDFNTAPATGDDVSPADGFADSKWSSGNSPSQQNGVANFTNPGSYIATASGIEVSPGVRPIYVSAYWTPANGANTFSILTRATPGSTTDGVAFTFGNGAIAIDGDTVSQTTGMTFTNARRYLLEVYDNGDDVWARATEADAPTVTATVRSDSVAEDLTGSNSVIFRSNAGTDTLDDVKISFPMLSLQTGASSFATAPASNGSSGSISIEAWVRPIQTTAGTILAQWSTDVGGPAVSAFRLYIDNGAAILSLNDGTNQQSVNLGIALDANTWTHVAATYNGTSHVVVAYKNGQFARSINTTLTGGVFASTQLIGFGADTVGGVAANAFTGQISDVRIWSDVRTASSIASCYQKRLGSTTCTMPAALVSNFRLDPTRAEGGFAETDLVAADGTPGNLNTAAWTPAVSLVFRPTSDDLCSSNRSGAYRCDFRTAGTSSVNYAPTLDSIYAKVWGAGGDGAPGDGGEYAGALVQNTAAYSVTVGDGGAGSVLSLWAEQTSVVERGGTAIMTVDGGQSISLGDLLGTLIGILTSNNTGSTAGNATDPYYNLSGTPTPPQNPGRGQIVAPPSAANDGAIVLMW